MAPRRLESLLARPDFRRRVARLIELRRRHQSADTWFQREHAAPDLKRVAYFSMEFALSEALPIYSGGLGNVAADQLKAACDLGVPVIGVGLLYQQGYFRQVIQSDGRQQALFPFNDPGQLPITPVRDATGAWLRVTLRLPTSVARFRVWHAQAGRRALYLLDSNDPVNPPAARAITSELYGGGPERRLQQELVLGIAGWRLLRALDLEPEVCHLNEGHAAFAVLERARSFAADHGCSFEVALSATRAGNIFTTHTPVEAGFDRFAPDLVAHYLGRYAEDELGIDMRELLALGRQADGAADAAFNMAYLAVRGSAAVTGVSQLHGVVSRRLFAPLFPRWPEHEVPIGHVTNGVHLATWDSAAADALWTDACGCDRCRGNMASVSSDLRRVSDRELWQLRTANRRALVEYVRVRLAGDTLPLGSQAGALACNGLAPDVLTLGFARRFAAYKRPTLLLRSPERLLGILRNRDRPVQLVVAGKAHPADAIGQQMITDWMLFIRRPDVAGHVVFLPDYDLGVAERLVQGVDVWINTPERPFEASGTSGMKILVNGGLNASVLDGWWAEAFAPEVGWAIGDGRAFPDPPARDAAEAEQLYTLLEREIVPAFYSRDQRDIPAKWVAMMRESMARLSPQFSTNRVLRDYVERYYAPLASRYKRRAAEHGSVAARLCAWEHHIAAHWGEARFGALRLVSHDGRHEYSVDVQLGALDPDAVRVELFAEAVDGSAPYRHIMTRRPSPDGSLGAYEYTASVFSSRPPTAFTPRLVANHADALTPLEAPQILWQR